MLPEYKKVRNNLNSDIKKARINFYQNKFKSIFTDPKKLRNAVKELTSQYVKVMPLEIQINAVTYSGQALDAKFNSHFLNSRLLSYSMNCTPTCNSCIHPRAQNTIFLFPISKLEIYKITKYLSGNYCWGVYGLKARPIQPASHMLSGPLVHICNAILSTRIFSNKTKDSRVCVIRKDGY